jgi:hypothetical protein
MGKLCSGCEFLKHISLPRPGKVTAIGPMVFLFDVDIGRPQTLALSGG